MRSIDTGKATLEPQTVLHAADMFVVLSDPAIYEFENAPPSSEEWLRARYARLEARRSPDGAEQWLNWVLRLPSGALAGYVQATVSGDGSALIAYELSSPHWGKGLAYSAVTTMIAELATTYDTRQLWAILKRNNARSLRLLQRLQFATATAAQREALHVEADEILMARDLRL